MSRTLPDLQTKYEPITAMAGTATAVGCTVAAGCRDCLNSRVDANPATCRGPIRLLNTSVCPITQQQCIDTVIGALNRGQGGWIVTPNLDHVRRCGSDPRYAQAVRQADLRLADGAPLVWASRLQRTPLPERVAGSDLIWTLSEALGRESMSVYLLGGEPGTADAAARILHSKYPGLAIVGTCCPPVGFENDPEQMADLVDNLRAAQPDLVFVALGSPKQEYLIQNLRPVLPATWWIGVGISFSFVCGKVRRAPRWMQRCGLEWVHRLAQEPGRLAKRYLVQGLPFALQFLLHSMLRRPCESAT